MATITRNFAVKWGIPNLVGTLGVTVYAADQTTVLIARKTSGFKEASGGQYFLAIPSWDVSWGAYVLIDDGTTPQMEWFNPLPSLNADGTAQLPAVDGVSRSVFDAAMLAFASGKSTYTDNGDGTYTLQLKKQDGTTTAISVTVNKTTGARTAASIS